MRRQVTFRFPTDTEVRYPREAPKRGERLTRRGGNWVVIGLERDEAGLEIALCVRFADYVRQARAEAAEKRAA
ncbi:MAG TPA: hypothetical protein VFR32_00375 [Gaiellaceae bacterium]|nr:hypothetical protein [Gaiellaceae bacterium]